MAEWVTPPFALGDWFAVVTVIVEVLQQQNIESIELMHGWSMSDFDQSPEFEALQWQSETVALADLLALLQGRERLGFCLGHDDLFLTLPGGLEIKCCHEGDLHLQVVEPKS